MKKLEWLLYLLGAALVSASLYYSISDRNRLSECSNNVTGVVLEKYRQRSKGNRVRYRYTINGKSYEYTEVVQEAKVLSLLRIGAEVELNYSCSDHSISRIDENYYYNQWPNE